MNDEAGPLSNLLDTLKADVTASLAGQLLPLSVYGAVLIPDGGGGYESGWALSGTGEGVRGDYDALSRIAGGVPSTDQKIEILASSLASEPERGDKILIASTWWLIREITIDPARAWIVCQCYPTDAVT